ncbi:hypothetical protein [Persicitalea jodogahamensis]|uniref:Uncharacterized protein n=1 Tax=Persicitalea jodogahamensis TaxID=402147 RepID=A0A8J3D8J6_9BACT|nr:hypothetical protein [Persicitalea jodogahamensis]GHB76441.1 hypothetical protein GCM10007390_32970 [Persicitalea jodogahamensis]
MNGKQGIILYLKQQTARHGSLSSQCYQLAHSGGLTAQEMRDAIRAGLDLYDERIRKYEGRQAA